MDGCMVDEAGDWISSNSCFPVRIPAHNARNVVIKLCVMETDPSHVEGSKMVPTSEKVHGIILKILKKLSWCLYGKPSIICDNLNCDCSHCFAFIKRRRP